MLPTNQRQCVSVCPQKCLARSAGLDSFLTYVAVEELQRTRIQTAWNWLVANNPIYADPGLLVVDPVVTGTLSVQDPNSSMATAERRQVFPGSVIQLQGQGPRAGDELLKEAIAGLGVLPGCEVKYTDPAVLVKIFPSCFPKESVPSSFAIPA